MQQAASKRRRKMCTCCFGDGTSHCYSPWCRLPYPAMKLVQQHLRIACSAKNDAHLRELRVSTWLVKSTLDHNTHFYDNVAHDVDTGWVWLHKYNYLSLKNITYRNANKEWSFADNRLPQQPECVTWTYVKPHRVARVVCDAATNPNSLIRVFHRRRHT